MDYQFFDIRFFEASKDETFTQVSLRFEGLQKEIYLLPLRVP